MKMFGTPEFCFSAVVELLYIRTTVLCAYKDTESNKRIYLVLLGCTCKYADGTVHDVLADYDVLQRIKIADTNDDSQQRVLLETQWNCNGLSSKYSEEQFIDQITVTSEALDRFKEQREWLLKSSDGMEVEIVGLRSANVERTRQCSF